MRRLRPVEAARELEAALAAAGHPARADQEKRYLKSRLTHLGTSVPAIRRVAVDLAKARPDLRREDLLAVVEALWIRPVHECRMAVVELLDYAGELLEAGDIALIERLIRESGTWALVDGLAASVAGALVERFPELGSALDDWSTDADLWVRRSAMLALLPPLGRGDGDFDRFAAYADRMLEEREFFIRKAIGWVLRETGKKRPELVHGWLLPRAERAAWITVREAVKYLPGPMRDQILKAHRGD